MESVGRAIIAQSVAGVQQASRAALRAMKRSASKAEEARSRGEDELDLPVTALEGAEAVRDPASNDREETHEDRLGHGSYSPRGTPQRDDPPRLDLSA